MLQNRICSQVNTQEPTLTQSQTAPTPPPPPSPHHPPFFRPYKEPNILISTSLYANWMKDVQFFFFIFLQSRLSYTLKRCFTTSKKFI